MNSQSVYFVHQTLRFYLF